MAATRRAGAATIWIACAALAGAVGGVALDGRLEIADGLLYDLAIPFVPRSAPAAAPRVAVIAIDQASLDAGRLQAVPRVFFGPYYAELIDGLFRADASAIGFDVVFNYSANRFPAIEPGYDTRFLAAVAANRPRIALARTARVGVAETVLAAAYDPLLDGANPEPAAVAYAELAPSADGVQRWVLPEVVDDDGTRLPTLAARLKSIVAPGPAPGPFLLAPPAPLETLPTYALADVLECITQDPAAVRKAFAGKVVLVGSNLAEEDRKTTPDRFLRRAPADPQPPRAVTRCEMRALGATDINGRTVPGVHFHAAALEQMFSGQPVRPVPLSARVGAAAAVAVLGMAAAWLLPPLVATFAVLVACVLVFAVSVLGIGAGAWLPAGVPLALLVASAIAGQAGRFLLVERRRRRVEQAFGRYLAPAIVDELASAPEEPHLGGETREVTVMFADLSGFTAASDRLEPQALMAITNGYFATMVAAIDEHGGYVDKYVGDAVMALWGAPVAGAEAPRRALDCALAIQQRVRALGEQHAAQSGTVFTVRIAIASGPAIVGNVGAPGRFNYTALGAPVNLAARLEATCKDYGVDILVDEATREGAGEALRFVEIDAVLLKGKAAPVAAFALLLPGVGDNAPVEAYAAALAAARAGNPERAIEAFAELARQDGSALAAPARRVLEKLRAGSAA